MPSASIVIVTYNSIKFIDRCLAPLSSEDADDLEVVVVDNVSSDGTADHIARAYPKVRLVRSPTNGGFAAGNNLGFRYCTAPVVLLLNPDAFLEGAQQLHEMAQRLLESPEIGAVGPRLVNADGSHQTGDAGWRLSLATVIVHMFFLQRFWPSLPALFLTSPKLLLRDRLDVDWVCGACMLVRREIIEKVGGLDERIFLYGEDAEWGLRIRSTGYRIVYLPQIHVTHLQGGTQKGEADTYYSTKWLDACLAGYGTEYSPPTFLTFKVTMIAGFFVRSVLYYADGLIRWRGQSKTKGRHMWGYMRHVARLRRSELAYIQRRL